MTLLVAAVDMASLFYLALAVTLSVVGTLILWLRHRKPQSLEHGIEEFSRELRALSPERRAEQQRRAGRGGRGSG